MFFLDPFERDKKSPSLFLQNCGHKIDKGNWNNIISYIQKNENSNFKEKQKKMLVHAVDEYVTSKDLDVEVRFDIIGIIKNTQGIRLEHLEDAFLHF